MATPEEIGAGIATVIAIVTGTLAAGKKMFGGRSNSEVPPERSPEVFTKERHEEICELNMLKFKTALKDELSVIFSARDKWLTEKLNEHTAIIVEAVKRNGGKSGN